MSDTIPINTHPVIQNNSELSYVDDVVTGISAADNRRKSQIATVDEVDRAIDNKSGTLKNSFQSKSDTKTELLSEADQTGNINKKTKINVGKDQNIVSIDNHSTPLNSLTESSSGDNLIKSTISRNMVDNLQSNKINEISGDNINDERENDNASVLVIILQCETKPCDQNIINLKWVFSDPYFTVQICAVDLPQNIPVTKTLTNSQYVENYFMRKALTYAAEGPYLTNSLGLSEPQFWWNTIPVIIVKDSSVSNITPSGTTNEEHIDNSGGKTIGGLKHRIKVALDKARQADLFFLCKWNDACNKYVDVKGVSNTEHGSSLKWSIQPTASQAIMYTPSSRDYIRESLITATVPLSDLLNTNISKGDLLATVFVPNIIDFDIDLATSNDDYNKLNECAPAQTSSQSSSNVASFLWFAVIIILVILVAWFLIQLGPQYVSSPTR